MARRYECVEKPPDDYICPVTAGLLVEANQTICCGSHLSESVSQELEKEGKPCPLCKNPKLESMKDLYFRKLIGKVRIYCIMKSLGCKWEGEVNSLEQHLSYGSFEGECKYVEVKCPYICFQLVQRQKIPNHMKNVCSKRPFICNYCNYEASHSYIVNEHLPVCEKFPIRCPNGCDELLCRSEKQKHIELTCPLKIVHCKFHYAGCIGMIKRKDIEKHMEQNVQLHLTMMSDYNQKKDKEIEVLKSQIQILTNVVARYHSPSSIVAEKCKDIGFIPPPIMVLQNFQAIHAKKECWRSSSFYSHIGGYKMCLLVHIGRRTSQIEDEYMGIYLQMLVGEFDDKLKWPFYGKVEIRMLNQLSDEKHIERVILDESSYSNEAFHISMVERVTGNEAVSIWGQAKFIALKNLGYNQTLNTQYLKDDVIKFEITHISLLMSS